MADDGSGAKAFGGVMAVLAVLGTMSGVVAAIAFPTHLRISSLQKQVESMNARMAADDIRERHDAASIAAIGQQFVQVETRFNAAKERSDDRALQETKAIESLRAWAAAHDLRVVALNSTQTERLRVLERKAFGDGSP